MSTIFTFPKYEYLSQGFKNLPEKKTGAFLVNRFPNGETYIKLKTNVSGKDCVIIGSITPPDENLLSFLLLAHTLKKEGALKITAFLPYLAYARQDKEKAGESLAALAIGEIFRASHISEVAAIDIHSSKAETLFPLSIHNLSSAKLFAKEIKKLKLKNPTFVSPDEGGIERTKAVLEEVDKMERTAAFAYMKKERTPAKVSSILVGKVNPTAVIIDDILDTGGTLLACCKILKSKGVKNIYIFAAHGLFTGSKWQKLFELNVKKIYTTDSIPEVKKLKLKNLKILSIRPLVKEYSNHLKKVYLKSRSFIRSAKKIEFGDIVISEE